MTSMECSTLDIAVPCSLDILVPWTDRFLLCTIVPRKKYSLYRYIFRRYNSSVDGLQFQNIVFLTDRCFETLQLPGCSVVDIVMWFTTHCCSLDVLFPRYFYFLEGLQFQRCFRSLESPCHVVRCPTQGLPGQSSTYCTS
jgi:hypothetical protein